MYHDMAIYRYIVASLKSTGIYCLHMLKRSWRRWLQIEYSLYARSQTNTTVYQYLMSLYSFAKLISIIRIISYVHKEVIIIMLY